MNYQKFYRSKEKNTYFVYIVNARILVYIIYFRLCGPNTFYKFYTNAPKDIKQIDSKS